MMLYWRSPFSFFAFALRYWSQWFQVKMAPLLVSPRCLRVSQFWTGWYFGTGCDLDDIVDGDIIGA